MTAQQLINQLQAIIKKNPTAANKQVVLSQYDSESSATYGYEPASDVHDTIHNVEII